MKNQPAPPAAKAPTPARKPANGKQKLLDQIEQLEKQLVVEKAAHENTAMNLKSRTAALNESADLRSAVEGKLVKAQAALKPFYDATAIFSDDKAPRWPDGGAIVLFGRITAADIRAARDAWLAVRA